MQLKAVIFLLATLFLAGCVGQTVTPGQGLPAELTRDSRYDQTVYRILDTVNLLRTQRDLAAVALSSELFAAAQTHAYDMSRQNRPWHFGSDGSSPLDRVVRSRYQGTFRGENISESYEDEFETIAAWMENESTRNVILDDEIRQIGIGWKQEVDGKNWWVLVTGT